MATAPSFPGTAGRPRRRPAVPNGLYRAVLGMAGVLFVALLVGFVVDLVIQARPAFAHFGIGFVVGTQWNAVTSRFGALPFIVGTFESTVIAMVLAIPIGLGAALSLSHLLPPRARVVIGGAVELLAAIPSIVYGLGGIFVRVPFQRKKFELPLAQRFPDLPLLSGQPFGIGMLSGGLILAVMVIPFITSVSQQVLEAVPNSQREAALSLGTTKWEMIRTAVLPYARSGVVGAIMLGLGRALGETMAITMVIGNVPGISLHLFDPGYTMASVLANEFSEATSDLHRAALIEIGLLLFVIAILINILARLLISRTAKDLTGAKRA